jgi:hypothetical protein
LAYEFGITPAQVLAESDRMQATMGRYLRWRSIQEQQARKG